MGLSGLINAPHPHRTQRHRRRTLRHRRRGLTLIETALATAIIGLGVVSMVELLAAGTMSNIDGAHRTTAVNLAKNVRERSVGSTFDEVRALHGTVHDPAIDSQGVAISGLSGWKQHVTVSPVDPENLSVTIVDSDPTAVRVMVKVTHRDQTKGELSWFCFEELGP